MWAALLEADFGATEDRSMDDGYDEYTLVFDDALDEVQYVRDGRIFASGYGANAEGMTLDEWLGPIESAARSQNVTAEVFLLSHGHAPPTADDDGECVCAQYATSHQPEYTFGPDDDN